MPKSNFKRLLCTGLSLAWFGLFSAPGAQESIPLYYDISWHKDMPVTFFAAFASVYGNYRYSQMSVPDEVDVLDPTDLLPWDRPVVGRYNKNADKVSDWAAALGAAPLALAGYSWYSGDVGGKDFAAYVLMLSQALALQNGVNLMVRSMQIWPRPYVYATEGDGAEAAKDARGEAYGSFFSGHTSAAFTIAVFTGEWFSEIYPESPYKGIVWASSLSAAGMVGALRIAAGKHFPSDVIMGALVGTGISLSVIRIHKTAGSKFSLYALPNAAGAVVHF